MKISFKFFVSLAAAISSCGMVRLHAQDFSNCSTTGDPSEDIVARVKSVRPGEIIPGTAVRLHREPTANCEDDRYCYVDKAPPVTERKEGVEIGRKDSWVCVAFAGKRPLDVWAGWIQEQRWKRAAPEGNLTTWVGVWQNYNSKLWITPADNGTLAVRGDGIWSGSTGAPHFGDFSFVAGPEDGVLETPHSLSMDQCHVALRRVGSFIFGADNGNCGAMNVRFDGVYRLRTGFK